MSTIDIPTRSVSFPLIEGDRLDQPEFHQRYEKMQAGVRAELINGVVYMPSPVSPDHGRAAAVVVTWLSVYASRTPGVEAMDGTTVILGERSEPEPDGLLRIAPEYGGRMGLERGFLRGALELLAEVAKATRYIDLGPKRDDYDAAGVDEYVVRAMDPDELIWHGRVEGRLSPVAPDDDGLFRSRVFPGLWLDPRALLANDLAGVLATLERGLAGPEHAAFVARLAEARGSS